MTMKSLRKINTKLQFLSRKNEFLNPKLCRLLCNLHNFNHNFQVQSHLDYACISWYPLINQKMRKKLQVTQNKCTCFFIKHNSRLHIGGKDFKKINWLPTKERVEQRIATKSFIIRSGLPHYNLIRITLGHIWLWRCL